MSHPLDRITGRGWAIGILRVAAAIAIVVVVISWTGRESWQALLEPANLPWIALGAALAGLQRVLRIWKWSLILRGLPLVPRSLGWLLRLQFVGLLMNLVIPSSEPLKVWALSRTKRDAVLATETILMDPAQLDLVVGIAALGAAFVGFATNPWWGWIPGASLVVFAAVFILVLRFRKRKDATAVIRVTPAMMGISTLEAVLQLGTYFAALQAIHVPVQPVFFVAVFPLLYLSHIVMVTPGGLGVREALFALVFGGLTTAPAAVAVSLGLVISAVQLLVAVIGGTIAAAWPGESRRTVGGSEIPES